MRAVETKVQEEYLDVHILTQGDNFKPSNFSPAAPLLTIAQRNSEL